MVDPDEPSLEGTPVELAARLAGQARPGQILLGRAAFDLARGARAPAALLAPEVRWLTHGAYRFEGLDELVEICEVGALGSAPLEPPVEGDALRRDATPSVELALGWRPATGQSVPRRPGWRLVERLGEGGFGEVWLARRQRPDGEDAEPGEERVFKFCYEPERLRALKREVTLFRLLRENLGHRSDIARVLDWDFDEVPYFLESEYTAGGDLDRWAERRGGLDAVPLPVRLELVAEVADALAAAHSVGVLHKDVKPRNVLVDHDSDGRPRARLTDFGIGRLTDTERLDRPGFTVLGFTETAFDDGDSIGGTVQYMAPELLEGKPATIQADVYALGVMLYQVVVGDLDRALAPGWRREIEDPLLEKDIADCVDGAADRRLRSTTELAERLRGLEWRHAQRRAAAEASAARERRLRRRRVAGWAGLASAVLLVIVSIFAYQSNAAKNRELEAREQAEQRRRQAEDLIDFLLGDLRAELQPIGKLAILDKVGDQAMEYFAAVAEDQLSDEEVANYAKALHQVGQVRFSLGKVPGAIDAFEASLDMAARLAARDAENADWQFQLGQSHFWVGFLRWEQNDLDAALGEFEAYLRLSEDLVKRDPARPEWQLELAYAHSNVGQILEEVGRLGEADGHLGTSVRLFEALAADRADGDPLLVELSHVYAKRGRVFKKRGDLAAARTSFEASLDLVRRAVHAAPDHLDWQVFLSHAHRHVAEVAWQSGDLEFARGHYRLDAELLRERMSHDPDNLEWKNEWLRGSSQYVLVQLAADRPEQARRHLEEADRLFSEIIDTGSSKELGRLTRTYLEWSWACLLRAEQRLDLAEQRARNALEALEDLGAQPNLEWQAWMIRTHWLIAEIHLALDRPEPARARLEAVLPTAEGLAQAHPEPRHLDGLIRVLVTLGKQDEAAPWIERLRAMGYRRPDYLAVIHRAAPPASPGLEPLPG